MNKKYLSATSVYNEIEERYKELQQECVILEKRLEKYPKGKIHIVKKKNKIQYYLRSRPDEKSGTYLPKTEKKKISTYLQKKYDEDVYKVICKEKALLENIILKSGTITSEIQEVYSRYSQEIKELIIPVDMSDEDYAKAWVAEPFDAKKVNTEIPMFITNNGEHVRSKSELNIANTLVRYGVLYKYECPLLLSDGRIIYPDFTVLNIKRRKVMYWEHRGMMDDREYSRHAVLRLKSLVKEGIVLGDNLVITEETSNSPLGTDEIEQIINRYFV